jgi:hypothetical protein
MTPRRPQYDADSAMFWALFVASIVSTALVIGFIHWMTAP